MRQLDKSLVEQMQISAFEIENRKRQLEIGPADIELLRRARDLIAPRIDEIVDAFYESQTRNATVAMLIGDAGTLARLMRVQRQYVLDLLAGEYGPKYVDDRLRIGMVHRRIGVEPKLYLAAMHALVGGIKTVLKSSGLDVADLIDMLTALEKIVWFDVTLVFEMYERSGILAVQLEKQKTLEYADNLEAIVQERTRQLEEMSRTDPLTNLYNRRYLIEDLSRALRAAERRREPISVVYLDVNHFKHLNDRHGHRHGDSVLATIGSILNRIRRAEDSAYRYGGDEFCIFLPGCSGEHARTRFCRRFLDALEQQSAGTTVSIGISSAGPDRYVDAETMIHDADQRMYEDKRRSRMPEVAGAARAQSAILS